MRYSPADRLWLAALSSLIPRRRWGQVFPVTPATLLAWHRRLVGGQMGLQHAPQARQAADHECRQVAGAAAGPENPRWGELVCLGRPIGATTVWGILTAAGIDPAPRRIGPTWREFLTVQAEGIIPATYGASRSSGTPKRSP